MIKLADSLDEASAAKSQKATEASVKAMETAIATLKASFQGE